MCVLPSVCRLSGLRALVLKGQLRGGWMGAALGDDAPGPHSARMLRVWTRHEGDRQLVILPLQKEQLGPPDPQRLLGSSV